MTHMIEHAVSAIYDLTHGVGLAIITPRYFDAILSPGTQVKFAAMARNVWDIEDADDARAARAGIDATARFFSELGLPTTLSAAGIHDPGVEAIADKAMAPGLTGSLKEITRDDVVKIIRACA